MIEPLTPEGRVEFERFGRQLETLVEGRQSFDLSDPRVLEIALQLESVFVLWLIASRFSTSEQELARHFGPSMVLTLRRLVQLEFVRPSPLGLIVRPEGYAALAGLAPQLGASGHPPLLREIRLCRTNELRLKAIVTIELTDGTVIKGLKVIVGRGGLFISSPSMRQADGTYADMISLSDDAKKKLEEEILGYVWSEEDGPDDAPTPPPGAES